MGTEQRVRKAQTGPAGASLRRCRHNGAILLLTALTLGLGACNKQETTAPPPAGADQTVFKPAVSIKELMDSTVDPSADGVWDAVGVISTAAGVNKHEPRTEEEWHEVRRHAVTLIESMNLLALPGRRAAPVGAKAGLGELTPEQIDDAILKNRPEFDQFTGAVQDTAKELLKAVDRKDTAALTRIGGDLDQRCEACHVTFWYPNSARPAS